MTTLNPLAFDDLESFKELEKEEGLKRGWTPVPTSENEDLRQGEESTKGVLAHFGKKGMKWGVRNTSSSSGSGGGSSRAQKRLDKAERKFDKTFEKKGRTNQLKVSLHNDIGPVVQSKVNRLNASPKYANAISSGRLKDANAPITKQYVKDFNKIYLNEMNSYLKGYQSPKGKTVKAELNSEDFLGFSLKVQNGRGAVKHADEVLIRVNYVKDENGAIVGFEVVDDELTQSAIDDVLAHFGTKGMKWGVRRSRESKVTVTDKGKRVKTKGGFNRPAHSDAVSVRVSGQVAKKSGVKALSNEELKAFNNRLNLEQQAKRLQYNDQSPPKKFVLKILGQTGNTQASDSANAVASKQVKKLLVKAAVV